METSVKVRWNDGPVTAKERAAAQAFCESFGLAIQRMAQEIVPFKEGTLQGSATTEPLGAGKIGVRVAFGGPAELYAAYQHETMLNHPNGRQWKYLETPFKQEAPKFPRGCELAIRVALKGGS
jgi:hypothetical protein